MTKTKDESRTEIIKTLEEMIKEPTISEKRKLNSLDGLGKAQSDGILKAAQIGTSLLEGLKKGQTYEFTLNSLENRLRSSIYELFKSESKYERDKSELAKTEIAYYGSLVGALQILKDKFDELKEN